MSFEVALELTHVMDKYSSSSTRIRPSFCPANSPVHILSYGNIRGVLFNEHLWFYTQRLFGMELFHSDTLQDLLMIEYTAKVLFPLVFLVLLLTTCVKQCKFNFL